MLSPISCPGAKKGIPAPSRIRPPTSVSSTGGQPASAAVARSTSSASLGCEAISRSLSNASSASNLASETEAERGPAAACSAGDTNATVINHHQQLLDAATASDSINPSDILTHDVDDFIIGDRVWVNGSKPGYIQFIGETKFAPGDWAGVVLDEPIGKNDGAVSGVRYFQCEPRRGVFARPQRLSRYPTTVTALSGGPSESTLIQESPGKSVTTRTVVRPCSPATAGRTTPNSPRAVITNTESVAVDHGLRIGDRVIVNASSGFKAGTLRYIGTTEFAQGHWCGVELDEPTGKNDGSVNGKRYFACRSKYGLFAPVHKVAREGGHTTTTVHTTTRTTKITSPPRLLSRTGSRESVASVTSNISSTSTSSKNSLTAARQLQQRQNLKPRLGVTALAERASATGQQQQQQISQQQTSTGSNSQDALREKEEHIEQLLKERDLEQTEIARVTAHREKAEAELHALQADYTKATEASAAEQAALRRRLAELEREQDESKKKFEDLQFELEELQIITVETERERQDLVKKVGDLQTALNAAVSGNGSDVSSQANLRIIELEAVHRQQMEDIKKKLEDAREKLKAVKDMRENDNNSHKETEKAISLKQEQLKTLNNELSNSRRECESLRAKVEQLESELFEMAEKNQDTRSDEIEELRSKLTESDRKLIEERQSLLKTQTERTDLLTQCDIFENQIKELQRTNDNLQQDLGRITSDHERLSAELRDEIDVLRNKLQVPTSEISDLEEKMKDQEDKMSSMKSKISELLNEKESLSNELETSHLELETKKKYYEATIKKVEQERESLRVAMENTTAGLKTELNNLKALLDQTLKDGDGVQERLTAANAELKELRLREAKILCDLENTQGTLASAISETEMLRGDFGHLKVCLAEIDRKKVKAERELEKESDRRQLLEQKLIHVETLLINEKEASKRRLDDVEESLERSRQLAGAQSTASQAALKRLQEEKDDVDRQVDQLRRSVRDYQEQLDEEKRCGKRLEESNSQLGEQLESLRKLVESTATDKDRDLGLLLAQLEEKRRYEDKLQGELVDAINDSERLRREHSEQRKQLEDMKCQLDKKSEQLIRAEKSLRKNEADRKEQVLNFKGQMEGLRNEFDRYRRTLEEQLKSTAITSSEIEGQRELVEQLHRQLSVKEAEARESGDEVAALHMRIKDLEKSLELQRIKNENLQQQNQQARMQNRSQRSNSPTKKFPFGDGIAADEDKDSQIDFLNSIIVDMQRKNDEYRARIQVLETTGPTDFKPSIADMSSTLERPSIKRTVVRVPRTFCDICEVFDLHETEDCPRQASYVIEASSHSHHGGPKGISSRPYCDNCETFGHTEADCDIEEF
ncbi:CAP-Gly domain-containing linker protein 1-like isoform X2 [Varroa destructor]|uniref:CAP-Gly domain-containing protein n=1 Tax=Varroa destructor TaxID=109461 RepID=A0A7M7MCV6_VARDE|nr:CAP-Gly domain-containing linker protein 1-like isoform X2 [Varroa destructor]